MPRPKDGVKGQPAWWFSRLWVGDTCHHPSQGDLSLQSICKLAEWPLQWRTDMWSQQSRQHVHTHFLIHYLSSPKNRGEKSAHLTGQETARGHCRLNPNLACPRLQEETSRAIAGSPGLGQRLVAQPQREGALRAGRGDVTYKITPSMGTHLSALVWRGRC